MGDNEKVFSSKIVIPTSQNCYKNNLYDLLSIIPARPLELKNDKIYKCDFIPKTDKLYIPKRSSKVKVNTVRDIRSSFESDTYTYLTNDLKSQESYLLKKIREGCSRNVTTKNITQKMLRGDAPISRPAWQMLTNINPEDHIHPRQYVMWNGKLIQVNGSYGGNNKMINNYDLASTKLALKVKRIVTKTNVHNKKNGLLSNSLAIKFKPGPLGRKKFLDDSHQKYHGDIVLMDLPKVGLVIQPTYGTALEPTITRFLCDLRCKDGIISEKWAEFAVSVLGKNDGPNSKLLDNECMTFDLKYKCDQRRILMRKDLDHSCITPALINTSNPNQNGTENQHCVLPEIKDMMHKILDTVEIHINQDKMFTTDESLLQNIVEDSYHKLTNITTFSKDKGKRKYCELGRLDVTVIQLPENSDKSSTQICEQAYCSLGCVCDSIKGTYKFRGHCGREACMFDCKCDFSKYISYNAFGEENIDILPGIINIEDEINMRLAKEEQKFHQTIIVTGEKNILFKSEKRNWKSSKKYETFYKNMCLKNVNDKGKRDKVLSIPLVKLDCDNIEPWCMVHNLYKCFCKGAFRESTLTVLNNNLTEEQIIRQPGVEECSLDTIGNLTNTGIIKQTARKRFRQATSYIDKSMKSNALGDNSAIYSDYISKSDSGYLQWKQKSRTDMDIVNKQHINSFSENSDTNTGRIYEDKSVSESSDSVDCFYSEYKDTCSRVNTYPGRKYSRQHYKYTNRKIKKMERNDKTLQQRLLSIIKECLAKETGQESQSIEKSTETCTNAVNEADREFANFLNHSSDLIITASDGEQSRISFLSPRYISYNSTLVRWVETNYKMYKKLAEQGIVRTSMRAPVYERLAMFPWEFILRRYRERKNLFLITKQSPYQIFMGVHTKNKFFTNCININEIRFAQLHKYPQTIKNLLTNATDLKEHFCILRGLPYCWEIVGSVTKISKNDEMMEEISDDVSDAESVLPSNYSDLQSSSDEQLQSCTENNENIESIVKEHHDLTELPDDAESSKWFLMTLENDFTEIRFFKKGFFVKYESIIRAINVARTSKKTVRLSSQKCADKNNGPQFGIYAIPNTNEYCVFIGPYELQDSLGIETIKSIYDVGKTKRTRGFWINTNKIDNIKVVDNPLSFMPPNGTQNNKAVPLDGNYYKRNHQDTNKNTQKGSIKNTFKNTISQPAVKKIVKPIRIRKTNGFYHLATDGMLKKITLKSPQKVLSSPTLNSKLTVSSNSMVRKSSLSACASENSCSDTDIEKGPQIKIAAVYSQKVESKSKTTERGMFILKPEEINRKLFQGNLIPDRSSPAQDEEIAEETITNIDLSESPTFQDNLDISVTLGTCSSNTDVYVISDDEEFTTDEVIVSDDRWEEVLLQCTNVTDIGYVSARQNCDSQFISFKVPGGQYSEFFPELEAFQKLNSTLSSIINSSRYLELDWRVVDFPDKDQGEVTIMDCENLHRVFRERQNISVNTINDCPVSTGTHLKTYCKKTTAGTSSSTTYVTKSEEKIEVPVATEEEMQF